MHDFLGTMRLSVRGPPSIKVIGSQTHWRPFLSPSRRYRACTRTSSYIKARWEFDARYGYKSQAITLLKEWVSTIGKTGGLSISNTTILSGAIGVPESRIEMEVALSSLEELEALWASIPAERHKEWGERLAPLIVDGSPTWRVYRTTSLATDDAVVPLEANSGQRLMSSDNATRASSRSLGTTDKLPVTTGEALSDVKYFVDWKGDRIKINPGDKLPGISFS